MKHITKSKYINYLQVRRALLHIELQTVNALLKEIGAPVEPEPILIGRDINYDREITNLMKAVPEGLTKSEIVNFLKQTLFEPGLNIKRLQNEVSSELMLNKRFKKIKKNGKYKYTLNKK